MVIRVLRRFLSIFKIYSIGDAHQYMMLHQNCDSLNANFDLSLFVTSYCYSQLWIYYNAHHRIRRISNAVVSHFYMNQHRKCHEKWWNLVGRFESYHMLENFPTDSLKVPEKKKKKRFSPVVIHLPADGLAVLGATAICLPKSGPHE